MIPFVDGTLGNGAMKRSAKACLPLICALGSACAGVVAEPSDDLFDIHEIDTGSAEHQTLLVGSFTTPGSVELAVIDILDGGERRLTLHRLDGDDWNAVRQWPLDRHVLFVDRVNVDGRDHVLTFRRGSLGRFDVDSGSEERLVAVTITYDPGEEGGLPRLDVARDLNGDGRDDLVVPDTDGFWVSTQSEDGSFVAPLKLGPAEPLLDERAYGDTKTYGEVGITPMTLPWYLGRVHRMDYDRDGRTDLVFWNQDHFEVHRQDSAGRFHAESETFTTEVPFGFDGAYTLAFQFEGMSVPTVILGVGGRIEHTLLHGFRDLNADGVADLVTLTFSGRRVFSLRGRYDVHFGRPSPGGTVFPATADTSATTPGPAVGQAWGYASQSFVDFDGDGTTDVAMVSVNTGFGGMARAMVAKSIMVDVAFFRLSDGEYPRRPDARRKVRTPLAPFDKRGVLFPTVVVGDVNGDGRSDVLAVERWDEWSVYLGTSGPNPLSTRPVKVAAAVPMDDRFATVRDLNGDGSEDVVIHHRSKAGVNGVVVLMARRNS